MKRYGFLITGLFLSAALLAPLATKVSATPQVVSVRVYDRNHKDYHDWDDRETRSYEAYRHEHRGFSISFQKNNRRQQSDYWKWRHEHPDHDQR
jgi:hypothetical protein